MDIEDNHTQAPGPEILPFRIEIPQADLDDLRDRLARTLLVGDVRTFFRPLR